MGTGSIWERLAGAAFAQSYVKVGEWNTRIWRAGEGPALVLMHGTGGHLETYARNMEALSQRFDVIAYDFPGHGYTTHTSRDLEIPDYTAHLAALLDTLGIERAHISGESLGGWVALAFAAAYPQRVDRLIGNTPGGRLVLPEVMATIKGLSMQAVESPTRERIRARLSWLMADQADVTDELVGVRQAIYSRPGFRDSMRHLLCLQEPDIRARNLVTDEDLARISAPTLVLWTTGDPSGPPESGREIAEKIPGARFVLLQDAAHWPQWEQPDAFNELVLRFLSE
jgi:2-hydroxy-6-oxonona-2,4-dienedioate hydrolase